MKTKRDNATLLEEKLKLQIQKLKTQNEILKNENDLMILEVEKRKEAAKPVFIPIENKNSVDKFDNSILVISSVINTLSVLAIMIKLFAK